MTKPAIAYCRQSRARPNEQAKTSLSLEQQEESIKAWADRNGYQIEAYVRDHDESGRSLQRPGILELKERVRPGVTVAVWKFDRFARNLIGAELAVEALRELGASVVSTTEPNGKLPRQLMGSIAEYYSDQLSERLIAIREAQARRGSFTGGQPPYGYMRRDTVITIDKHGNPRERRSGPLVPHPDESRIVREVHRRYLNGDSLYAISVDLVARGIPRSMGGTWNTTLIHKLLANPFYAGYATHKGVIVAEGVHEPLIDRAAWEAVQARLARHQVIRNDSPNTASSWLEGLVQHACGHRMYLTLVGGSEVRYPNFVCQHAQGPYRCNVPRISIAQGKLEAMVRDRLVADFAAIKTVELAIKEAQAMAGGDDATERRTALGERRRLLERTHVRARELYLASEDSLVVWQEQQRTHKTEIAIIEAELDALPGAPDPDRYVEVGAMLHAIAPTLKLASGSALRRILEPIGVVVFSQEGAYVRYDEPWATFLNVAG